MGILFFILSSFLQLALTPILLLYSFFKYGSFKEMDDHYKQIAISKDQLGNVIGKYFWNNFFTKGQSYSYGNPDETISSATGKNKQKGTLSKTGILFDRFLSLFQKNHSIRSIEKDEGN